MESKSTMTVKELMVFLGISRATAYELVNDSGFPSFRIGRKVLINRAGLEEWMKEQEAKKDAN